MCRKRKGRKLDSSRIGVFHLSVAEELIGKRDMHHEVSAGYRVYLKTQNNMEGVKG